MTQQWPEARRFVTLVDLVYERNVRMILFARQTPDKLFTLRLVYVWRYGGMGGLMFVCMCNDTSGSNIRKECWMIFFARHGYV